LRFIDCCLCAVVTLTWTFLYQGLAGLLSTLRPLASVIEKLQCYSVQTPDDACRAISEGKVAVVIYSTSLVERADSGSQLYDLLRNISSEVIQIAMVDQTAIHEGIKEETRGSGYLMEGQDSEIDNIDDWSGDNGICIANLIERHRTDAVLKAHCPRVLGTDWYQVVRRADQIDVEGVVRRLSKQRLGG